MATKEAISDIYRARANPGLGGCGLLLLLLLLLQRRTLPHAQQKNREKNTSNKLLIHNLICADTIRLYTFPSECCCCVCVFVCVCVCLCGRKSKQTSELGSNGSKSNGSDHQIVQQTEPS